MPCDRRCLDRSMAAARASRKALLAVRGPVARAVAPYNRAARKLDATLRKLEGFPELRAELSPAANIAQLRGQIDRLLAELMDVRRITPPRAKKAKRSKRSKPVSQSRVLAAVRKLIDPKLGLAFVPGVLDSLGGGVAARAALSRAAEAGQIELRPEGGMGRLSADELARSLPGPQGTRLSWARVVGGKKARVTASEPLRAPIDERVMRAVHASPEITSWGNRRISDVRKRLPDVPRALLDSTLKRLQKEGRVTLVRYDNNADVTPDEKAAELDLSGFPRHVVRPAS